METNEINKGKYSKTKSLKQNFYKSKHNKNNTKQNTIIVVKKKYS
jgi:hypothetical protein